MREPGDEPARSVELSLEAAREALRHEAAAVSALVPRIGGAFAEAIEHVLACEGRVVVTGLGKSGIVARKIAATLSSTGTPALFVHSGEAHHGDAGMVMSQDIVLAISYSGSTTEVVEFVRLLRSRGIVAVAMTASGNSPLARLSNLVLDISVEREADELDLVPTSSTTAAMAMGDALSVALMARLGFQAEAFARNHPGGSLGDRLAAKPADTA